MQGVFEQAGARADLLNSAVLHYLGRVVQAQAYNHGLSRQLPARCAGFYAGADSGLDYE